MRKNSKHTPFKHGPAKGAGWGPGWGGPARGAHEQAPRSDAWTSESRPSTQKPDDMTDEEWAARKARNVARKDRAAWLENELYDIAMNGEIPPQVRVAAIDKALDRIVGKPIQANQDDPNTITVNIVGGMPTQK